ncbi:TlpA disulfide reductase family protein [Flavobacterium chungbukense]|uniref:Thioredoxin domain-containing protein n=1 Tax=Flavobacterium chungbukense TaxID=877464 RepID=A0ABP7YX80_9FLAO|nr:TlpA disulfide reductase family protein [Flavobacterium chungbukense]MCC4924043.1 AhpC/TSA family protein [Flavobacterium chungbukense]
MKYLSIIKITLLSLFLSVLNFKAVAQQKFHIDGTITGLTNGKIYTYKNNAVVPVEVKNGKFQIDGDMSEPVYNLSLLKDSEINYRDQKTFTYVLAESGAQTLKINYSDFRKSVLTGSKTQDDSYRYDAIRDKIMKKYKKEFDKVEVLHKKLDDAVAAKKDEKTTEAIKYEINDAKEFLEPAYKEITDATLKFMKDNPKSYFSMSTLLYYLNGMTYDEAKVYYDSFNPLYKNTESGKYLWAEIEKMKKGIPGVPAGPFNTTDINGKPLKLEDFKGKYVLIDFWASWCVPCRKGNPHLLKLYAEYKPKGLEILGVSDDDKNEDKWKKAVEKDGIGVWRHVLRGLQYKEGSHERINIDQDISEGYNIHSLPTKILVDPNGIIVARYDGGEADDKKMDEDLAKIFKSK